MDRHGNYNNEKLLEDSGSSVLSPQTCRYAGPKWAAKHGRIICFYYQLPKGGTKGVGFKDSLYASFL